MSWVLKNETSGLFWSVKWGWVDRDSQATPFTAAQVSTCILPLINMTWHSLERKTA